MNLQEAELGRVLKLWVRPDSITLQGDWASSEVSPIVTAFVESTEMIPSGDYSTFATVAGGVTLAGRVATTILQQLIINLTSLILI